MFYAKISFMKLLNLLTIFTLLGTSVIAQADEWHLEKLNLYIENDKLFDIDKDYTAGHSIELLYFIPKEEYFIYNLLATGMNNSDSYISYSLSNQIFTPSDTKEKKLIVNERPYAGWTYLESKIYKSSENQLRSLSLKLGIVGPGSGSNQIQNEFHRLFDINVANGWKNQLRNEVGVNLNFTQKYKISMENEFFQSAIIPFVSARVGNVNIDATAGVSARIGWNIPKDYGISTLDIASDSSIPSFNARNYMKNNPWSFSFNFLGAVRGVNRDIFLDGNTNKNSHSVEKESIINYFGYGFTAKYNNILIDLVNIYSSKSYKLQKEGHDFSSIRVSYLF